MQPENEMASTAQRLELIYFHKSHQANVREFTFFSKYYLFYFVFELRPKFNKLFISNQIDHFTAKLSVRTINGPDLVSTSFTFFDCSTHLSCTQCVSSQFPCDWCVEAHRCTHDTAENCRNDILVTGVSVSLMDYI